MKRTGFFKSIIRRYTEHEVGRAAASLTYFILFALFPFLLIVCAMLSYSEVIEIFSGDLASVIPAQVVDIIGSYIQHVEEYGVGHLLWAGFLLMLWSIYRAIATIVSAMNKAWDIRPGPNITKSLLRQLGLTVFATLCLFLLVAFVALNTSLIRLVTDPSPAAAVFIRFWGYLRLPLMIGTLYAVLSALFRHAPERELTLSQVFPGVAFSLVCWTGLSYVFAWYASNVANYSNIYGPLGTIIVLLLWINLGSLSMLLGSEFNAIMDEKRRAKRKK